MSSGLHMHIPCVLCMHMCTCAHTCTHTLSTYKGIILNHERMPIFIVLHPKDSILTGFFLTQLQVEAGFLEASSMLAELTYNLHPCHGSLTVGVTVEFALDNDELIDVMQRFQMCGVVGFLFVCFAFLHHVCSQVATI